jgi:hypothetical protein
MSNKDKYNNQPWRKGGPKYTYRLLGTLKQ